MFVLMNECHRVWCWYLCCFFQNFWNGDDYGMFSKIRYCVSVEGNVVHVREISNLMASSLRCLRCQMFMPLGQVKLLFVHLCSGKLCFLGGKDLNCMVYVSVDFVCAIWSDVNELFIKSFCFVYVSDSCFNSEANASVLLCR